MARQIIRQLHQVGDRSGFRRGLDAKGSNLVCVAQDCPVRIANDPTRTSLDAAAACHAETAPLTASRRSIRWNKRANSGSIASALSRERQGRTTMLKCLAFLLVLL